MKCAFILLCVLSVAAAAPFGFIRPGGRFGQGGFATGNAASNVNSGTSGGPFGNTQVTQLNSHAQGSTHGNAFSTNRASASHVGIDTPFGSSQFSNTDAVSNQGSFGGFGGSFGQQFGGIYG